MAASEPDPGHAAGEPVVRPATARLAVDADLDAIQRLRQAALAEQVPLRGGSLYGSREAAALPGAGDRRRPIWVGELAGVVIGYLAGRTEPLRDGRRLGVVEGVFVDPACRAVGVGEAMMDAALAWFRTQGCVGVDAMALPGARATKNFFEETGFTARLLVMHHAL
jgi:GNAT superfamily N-acetyltransferase